jgi:DNA-binding transcriptional regulator LsrR (DeoR family)
MSLWVAERYYLHRQSQKDIAREMGCSIATVSRLLRMAEDEGIVRIHIEKPAARATEAERDLCERFDLKACRVVGAPADGLLAKKIIGAAAAQLIAELVSDGDIVGLSWGVTMREVVNSLPSHRRHVSLTAVPLIGGLGQVKPEHQVNDLVHAFAECFQGNCMMLHAPALSDHESTVALLLKEAPISRVVGMWEHLTMAVVGIGESPPTSPMRKTGYYDDTELEELIRVGAVGDISGRFFDCNGVESPASANRRLLSIPFPTLRAVNYRVGVAGGPAKIKAITGALRGSLINILVTDSTTAHALIAQ